MTGALLVTGGVRSGKSHYAEARAAALGGPVCYIATAEARDAEMAGRIADHVTRRPEAWRTVEAPMELVAALDATDGAVRVVDCLTLWLSNLMLAERDWAAEIDALLACLGRQSHPVILVTNEVGWGIVPENALARQFRDASGVMNRRIADAAGEVVLVVAGQPLRIKPAGHLSAD